MRTWTEEQYLAEEVYRSSGRVSDPNDWPEEERNRALTEGWIRQTVNKQEG